jgi:hypothetical protein
MKRVTESLWIQSPCSAQINIKYRSLFTSANDCSGNDKIVIKSASPIHPLKERNVSSTIFMPWVHQMTWGTCVTATTAEEIRLLLINYYSICQQIASSVTYWCPEDSRGFHMIYIYGCLKAVLVSILGFSVKLHLPLSNVVIPRR